MPEAPSAPSDPVSDPMTLKDPLACEEGLVAQAQEAPRNHLLAQGLVVVLQISQT